MLYIVEIRHIGSDLDATQAELKAWLDNHGIKPVEFEHSVGGAGITFRVCFTAEEEAAAFASTFDGWLNKGDGTQAARWAARKALPYAASS